MITKTENRKIGKKGFLQLLKRDWILLAIIALPVIYIVIYKYLPMVGVLMAFQKVPRRGDFFSIFTNEWVGFQNFVDFFTSPYCLRLIKNTFLLSFYSILWSFPVPILFALILNEIKIRRYQRVVQTLTYIPYFISLVIAMGLVVNFLHPSDGVINLLLNALGKDSVNFISDPKWFRTIYIISGIWQSFGYNAIIYIAAINSIDQQLYEAATIDGATKLQQIRMITLPCIIPTIIIMLILAMGNLLNVGYEKILLLYSPSTYTVADVISTYVYRVGIGGANFGLGTAIGLFNSAINLVIIIAFNKLSKFVSGISLW